MGFTCSQIRVVMALESQGRKNPDIVCAMCPLIVIESPKS
jgi:hypothetical protein